MTASPERTVEVVLPVFNEAITLEKSVTAVFNYLQQQTRFRWRITIVDNASTDSTLSIASGLAERFGGLVFVEHLSEKGRGLALRHAWLQSNADVVAYMDIDLSTNLRNFLPLVNPLLEGYVQVSIGNRLLPGAKVERQIKREIISRSYNLLVKAFFPFRQFGDAQCGFKALTRAAVQELVPLVADNQWFFDTELLLRAEQLGYEIHQAPVEWIEDLDSSVKIIRTAFDDVVGLLRVRCQSLTRAKRRM